MWAWLLWMWVWTAAATDGHEIVLILDNSCSMVAGATVTGTGEQLPPNDPQRAAVLGTLLLEGLVRGSDDRLQVVGFGDAKGERPRIVTTADEVRSLPYTGGTWFRPALGAAQRELAASTSDDRVLVLFTDGSPSDMDRPKQAADVLAGAEADVIALGLYGGDSARVQGGAFLEALVEDPADVRLLDATSSDVVEQVVRAFTHAYADVLGSKPVVGALRAGEVVDFEVGKYVTEVMVTTASIHPGAPFRASLTGARGDVPPRAVGDNGCPKRIAPGNARQVCDPPRRHYQAFRGANDPYQRSTWVLALPEAPGPIEYGIILRYDLEAQLSVPSTTRVGEPTAVEARLLFHGQNFVDEAFFTEDGFAATLHVGDDEVALNHTGNGLFTGVWTPSATGPQRAEVRFTTAWMDVRDDGEVSVDGFVDLVLRPSPSPIDLGAWDGQRRPEQRCAVVDLSGSTNADRVPVTCVANGHSSEAILTCGPVGGSEAPAVDGVPGQPLQWEVCVISNSCCGEVPAANDVPFSVTFRGVHEHYASGGVTVDVLYRVSATTFLRCWWLELAILVGLMLLAVVLYGIWSPYAFDPALTVRIASTSAGLRRASALVLCEQPGGRRGFYRHARMSLMNDGSPVRHPATALLVVEARPGGAMAFRKAVGIEKQDRRTRRWVPMTADDLLHGPDHGVAYRIGGLYLRFG